MIVLLGLGFLLLFTPSEAGRCSNRYRESRVSVSEFRPRRCTGAGSFIGEDYWTTIGYDGSLKDGRTPDDFLRFNQHPNTEGYVAYWITRTRYGNVHYEAFGHASVRPDGRVCAWFVGLNKEIVDVCGGFRVLSRSRFRPTDEVPFEWTQSQLDAKGTLGFHEHRIAKFEGPDEVLYGDARAQSRDFQAVGGEGDDKKFVQVNGDEYAQRVWLLRRKPGVSQAVLYHGPVYNQ